LRGGIERELHRNTGTDDDESFLSGTAISAERCCAELQGNPYDAMDGCV
jgi:hypothetical protein